MAKITYKEGVEPINGTYCGMIFRTLPSGRHTAVVQYMPSEEEIEKSPAARADYIIKQCVSEIQSKMERKAAFEQYGAIRQRVQRLYKQLYNLERNNTKLQKILLEAYYGTRRVLPSRKVSAPTIDFGANKTMT